MNNRHFRYMSGVGMIEVLVTMLVLAVGLLGLAALQTQSVKASAESGQRSIALNMVSELFERMHMNRQQIDQYQTDITAAVCGAAPANQCSTGRVGGNTVAGVQCTPEELATFDVWDVMCDHGNRVAQQGKSTAFDFVVLPVMTMTCTNAAGAVQAPCAVNNTVTLNMTWQGRRDSRKAAVQNGRVIMSSVL